MRRAPREVKGRPPHPPDGSRGADGTLAPALDPAEARRIRWVRLRLSLVAAVVVLVGMVVLDVVLVRLLPVPEALAALAHGDVLSFGPVALGVAVLVTWSELRPMAEVLESARLGLRCAEEDRLRAVRAARTFPAAYGGAVLLVGTAGNVGTLLLDLQGRSPTAWHALHLSVVTQSLMLPFVVVLFLVARRTLRPIATAIGRPGDPFLVGLGMRGRFGLLLGTLALAAMFLGFSYGSLARDAQLRRSAGLRVRRVAEAFSASAGALSRESVARSVGAGTLPDGTALFVQTADGVQPAHLGSVLRALSLGPPVVGRWVTRPAGVSGYVAARGVRLADGTPAWVGGVHLRSAPQPGSDRGLLLVLGLVALSLLIGLSVGSQVAGELRALGRRVGAVVRGSAAEPLSPRVGAVREVADLVAGVNDLLAEAGRAELERYLRTERTLETTATRTQILANLSHDLRAPLTSILGFVELLLSESSGRLSPAQKERMAVVDRIARSLGNLVGVLLDDAKLDVGRLRIARKWTPPAALVSRVVNGLVHVSGEAVRQAVHVLVQPGLSPIYVDPELTARAIGELVRLLHDAVTEPGSGSGEAVVRLRAARYATRGDRGVEIVVATRAVGGLDPTTQDWLRALDPEGSVPPSDLPAFRPGAAFARKVLIRQRARIEPFRQRPEDAEAGTAPQMGYRVRISYAATGEIPALRR